VREDYGLQLDDVPNADVPCVMLDNDFRDPDIDRFLERFDEYDPSVAVLGDAYTEEEAQELNEVACELLEENSHKELVVVPKCDSAFDVLDGDVTLGVPIGYSDIHAEDLGWRNYRGRPVHVLGAAPDKSYEAIQKLVQPNLFNDEPADVRGVDWNGNQKIAYKGEYWSRKGWKSADELSIRETVRKGLEEIKLFWQERGVWPETEPVDLYGEPVEEPDEFLWMDDGGDPISSREELESAYIGQYVEKGKLAFQSEVEKKFVEYREDLSPAD
jgi:hypothetical protein